MYSTSLLPTITVTGNAVSVSVSRLGVLHSTSSELITIPLACFIIPAASLKNLQVTPPPLLALANPVPEICNLVPPTSGPELGKILLTTGLGENRYSAPSPKSFPLLATAKSTTATPSVDAGLTQLTLLGET